VRLYLKKKKKKAKITGGMAEVVEHLSSKQKDFSSTPVQPKAKQNKKQEVAIRLSHLGKLC
jgi:hypothetical protein